MAVSWSNYANLKSQFEMFAFKKRYFFLFPTSYKNVSLMQQFTYLGRVWNVLNFFLKKKDIFVKKKILLSRILCFLQTLDCNDQIV
jgi:hypothetical protein